jgi:hypothetical protein
MAQPAHASRGRIKAETLSARVSSAISEVEEFVLARRRKKGAVTDMLDFEKALHGKLMGLERAVVKEELEHADIDVPAIVIEGTVYRQVLRAEENYQTAAGEVRVMRTLYKDRTDEPARAVVPMELRLGLIEGRWTPLAAQEALWVVAHMTPKRTKELFERMGNMSPSRSSLDRLPKQLSERWEAEREAFENTVRMTELVPDEAATVAVSLDGVMAPMKDGEASEKRAETAASGRQTKGPAGYREVGCGTVSFYDEDGELLRAVRIGRMPEPGKDTLKAMLVSELGHALAQRPDLRLVGLADGAKDNWTFLESTLAKVPSSVCTLDFFHAAEHVNAAFGAAYGDGSVQARATFAKWRTILLDDPDGTDKLIRSIANLRDKHPRSKVISQVLGYLRSNRHRMRYAERRAEGLPIGSGVVESACKMLVTQRMKNSGMRWGEDGGQAILTARSWCLSDRFDRAWETIAATYKTEVRVIAPVIELHRNYEKIGNFPSV